MEVLLNPKMMTEMTVKTFNKLSRTYFVVSPTKEPHKHYIVEKAKVGFEDEVDFASRGASEFEGHRLIPQDHSIPEIPIIDDLFICDLDILHLEDGQVRRSRMRWA